MYNICFDGPFFESGYHNFEYTSQLPRHRWYYFKEGYSSKLVSAAIKSAQTNNKIKDLKVIDPFSGSGTTALTCAIRGHHCTGIEVNPFLHFTAKAKATPGKWHKNRFLSLINELEEASRSGAFSPLEGYSTFSQNGLNTKWLFNLSVLRRYSALIDAISQVSSLSKNALKLAAIAAAFECSNVKRDGKALRYKKDWKDLGLNGTHFIGEFKRRANVILTDVLERPINKNHLPTLITGDSRSQLFNLQSNIYNLAVTSPPYLNSFDYSDVYRPELFLGNYVKNNAELRKIRMRTLRSHVQVSWDKSVQLSCSMLNETLSKLEKAEKLWSSRIPLMVHAYFDDLAKIFRGLNWVLKKGSEAWIVLGTSAYGGIHIPVDLIAAEIATAEGFELDSIHCLRHLRAAGQQWNQLKGSNRPLRESLLIVRKP